MTNDRTTLITGVTGQQGGAVAHALKGTGFHLRGMTRKPDSDRAAALAHQGIDIVEGDLDDDSTLRRALARPPDPTWQHALPCCEMGRWRLHGISRSGTVPVRGEGLRP